MSALDPQSLAKHAAAIASDKKGTRIVVIDLRGQSDVCDAMMVCSGTNDRQTRAIAQAIEEDIKARYGISPLAAEGKQNGHWVLLDYGGLIVHIFFDYLRDYYAIEKLWPDAKLLTPQGEAMSAATDPGT